MRSSSSLTSRKKNERGWVRDFFCSEKNFSSVDDEKGGVTVHKLAFVYRYITVCVIFFFAFSLSFCLFHFRIVALGKFDLMESICVEDVSYFSRLVFLFFLQVDDIVLFCF